jgi:hypothetical protein
VKNGRIFGDYRCRIARFAVFSYAIAGSKPERQSGSPFSAFLRPLEPPAFAEHFRGGAGIKAPAVLSASWTFLRPKLGLDKSDFSP